MNYWLIAIVVVVLVFFAARSVAGAAGPRVTPEEAAKRVAAGTAVLIDVREPDEWAGGVAKPALLLSLSDLRAARKDWKPVLEKNRDKELILYCRSGNRSGIAAKILADEGFKTINAGGFSAWQSAGLPTRKP